MVGRRSHRFRSTVGRRSRRFRSRDSGLLTSLHNALRAALRAAMWGIYDYLIWALSVGLVGYVLFRIMAGRAFPRYLALSTYLLATLSFTVTAALIYLLYGFRSLEDRYFFFFCDAVF